MIGESVATIFETPETPVWSSHVLDTLIPGEDRSTSLLAVIREIDKTIGDSESPITETQVTFLREIALRNCVGGELVITSTQLNWLVEGFTSKPTQIRALLLTLLVTRDSLPEVTRDQITRLLTGSIGERWLSGF